jgi:branched-chain amino acid transport system ATP-binding protein
VTLLTVRGVTVRFGGNLALDGVDLDADAGQVTGLIGPNGAGKTTLFNVICGLQGASGGEVRLGRRDLTRLAPYRRARLGLARTFQRLELFGLLTVRENVELAVALRRGRSPAGRADELIELVGLTDVAGVRADELSTGRARRVELARALATEPRVLLLDEPASGQDERETATFGALLGRIAADGVAVVLVEHDVQLVMRTCQVVHVLDVGSVLAVGSPEEIQRDPDVLDAYLGATPTGTARTAGTAGTDRTAGTAGTDRTAGTTTTAVATPPGGGAS